MNAKWVVSEPKTGVMEYLDRSNKEELAFNMPNNIFSGSKCEFLVPKKMDVKVDVGNAKVVLTDMEQNVFVKVGNGKVVFHRHPETKYRFQTRIASGKISGLSEIDYRENSKNAFSYSPGGHQRKDRGGVTISGPTLKQCKGRIYKKITITR